MASVAGPAIIGPHYNISKKLFLPGSIPRFRCSEKESLPFEFSRYRGFAGDAFAPVRNGTSIDAKHLGGGLVEDGTVWAVVHLRPRL